MHTHVQAINYDTNAVHVWVQLDFPADERIQVSLDNLLIQLRAQVTPFWCQFGEAVGVETEILDKFADNCPPQEYIAEMFDYWLRKQEDNPPPWRDVAKILKVINLG